MQANAHYTLNTGHGDMGEHTAEFENIVAKNVILVNKNHEQIILDYNSVKKITGFIDEIETLKKGLEKQVVEKQVVEQPISPKAPIENEGKCVDTDTCGKECVGRWRMSCAKIKQHRCHKYDKFKFVASEMCCVCGGGKRT